jgi:hypothetical protein
MVGVPLAGLFAILDWGAALVPPPHVGGSWSLTESCTATPTGASISIEQSGRFLRTRLGDGETARGRLDDGRLHTRVLANAGACEGHELVVDARLADDGQTLVGSVHAPTCSACPASTLSARRETESR